MIKEGGAYRFKDLSEEQIKSLADKNYPGFAEAHEAKIKGKKIFIRPIIDANFEKITFDLTARGGIDMLHLAEDFSGSKFDYIFAINLNPATQDKDWWTIGEDVLSPEGQKDINITDFDLGHSAKRPPIDFKFREDSKYY